MPKPHFSALSAGKAALAGAPEGHDPGARERPVLGTFSTLSYTAAGDPTLTGLIPFGLRVDVRPSVAELPDEPGAIWATVGETDDPEWPSVVNFLSCGDECDLGPFPDLRIALAPARVVAPLAPTDEPARIEHLPPDPPAVSVDEALGLVFGYAVGVDLTRRDQQAAAPAAFLQTVTQFVRLRYAP